MAKPNAHHTHRHHHHEPPPVEEQQQLEQALRERLQGTDVDALLQQGGEEGLTPVTLHRWLVARKVGRGVEGVAAAPALAPPR